MSGGEAFGVGIAFGAAAFAVAAATHAFMTRNRLDLDAAIVVAMALMVVAWWAFVALGECG